MLGQVAGTVSHELRNPLSAIRNSMALVRQLTVGKAMGVERAIERVDRNVNRCARIIDDILDFTRVRELTREPIKLDAWLGETLAEIAVPPSVSVRREFLFDDEVALDRERFRQIVVNLVDNAAQALADAGWTPTDDRQRTIIVRTEAAGPHVRLSVTDNGPGIPRIACPRSSSRSSRPRASASASACRRCARSSSSMVAPSTSRAPSTSAPSSPSGSRARRRPPRAPNRLLRRRWLRRRLRAESIEPARCHPGESRGP